MTKTILLLVAVFVSVSLTAQEKTYEEYKTIFGSEKLEFSGIGGFDMAFTSFNGYFGVQTGGSMAVLLNSQLFIGGYGQSATIDRVVTIQQIEYRDVSLSHGGFWAGYIFLPNAAIHPVVSAKAGWGKAKLNDYYNDNVFVINPMVEIQMNITHFFRIGVGAHYTITSDVETIEGLSKYDFSGPGGTISFKFGWFK